MSTATNLQFQKIKAVTLPVLKLELNETRYIAILGAMHEGKKIDDKKEPATLAHAVDMRTGEEGLLICATVLKKELQENYPGEDYVGKGFEITKHRDPEKKYNVFSIAEVSIPEEIAPSIDAMRTRSARAESAARKANKVKATA